MESWNHGIVAWCVIGLGGNFSWFLNVISKQIMRLANVATTVVGLISLCQLRYTVKKKDFYLK